MEDSGEPSCNGSARVSGPQQRFDLSAKLGVSRTRLPPKVCALIGGLALRGLEELLDLIPTLRGHIWTDREGTVANTRMRLVGKSNAIYGISEAAITFWIRIKDAYRGSSSCSTERCWSSLLQFRPARNGLHAERYFVLSEGKRRRRAVAREST